MKEVITYCRHCREECEFLSYTIKSDSFNQLEANNIIKNIIINLNNPRTLEVSLTWNFRWEIIVRYCNRCGPIKERRPYFHI